MVSGARYASVILPVLAGGAVLCSMPRGSTESALGCILAHFCYVSIAIALKALSDYTIPTIRFAFVDLVVPD